MTTVSRLTSLLTLALVAACSAEPAPGAEFEQFMEAVVAAHDFAGAVVVMRGDAVVYEGAWGLANREEGVAFTPDTPIDGGSLAKTFTAAGIWQLHAEGRLSVDATVATYVPEFPHAQTTVRHLLTHSAGLPELDDPTGLTNLDIVLALDSVPSFEPGSRFSYCNECFDILALVTERVTGQHWSEFLATRFFAPNGLDAAFLRPALLADWSGTRTRSYRATPNGVVLHDVVDDEPFYGSANIYLSAREIARWARAAMHGSGLPAEVLAEAQHRPVFSNGERSALTLLNWYQPEPGGPATFDGHWRGFHAVAYWDPRSELVIAWLSNTLDARPQELQLTRSLIAIAEGATSVSSPRFAFDVPTEETGPEPFQGTFEVEGLGLVEFDWDGGIGLVRIDGGPVHAAYPSHGLYLPDFGAELGFRDREGDRYRTMHWLTLFDSVAGSRVGGE